MSISFNFRVGFATSISQNSNINNNIFWGNIITAKPLHQYNNKCNRINIGADDASPAHLTLSPWPRLDVATHRTLIIQRVFTPRDQSRSSAEGARVELEDECISSDWKWRGPDCAWLEVSGSGQDAAGRQACVWLGPVMLTSLGVHTFESSWAEIFLLSCSTRRITGIGKSDNGAQSTRTEEVGRGAGCWRAKQKECKRGACFVALNVFGICYWDSRRR